MSNPFALQVTPELMQRLVEPEKKPRRKQAKKPVATVSPPPEDESDLQQVSPGGWPDPYFPPFGGSKVPFAGIFGSLPAPETSSQDTHLRQELEPVYEAIEKSEQIAQRLQSQGHEELERVQEMARDLEEKQYRAPSNAPPCGDERAECIKCYRENDKNPLLCSKLVQAFVSCSRQAQEHRYPPEVRGMESLLKGMVVGYSSDHECSSLT